MMTGGVGTFQYMAPEVLDADYGVSEAGLAVDVYSFGMLVCIVVRGYISRKCSAQTCSVLF
jgi:serine/threonine protein kinase